MSSTHCKYLFGFGGVQGPFCVGGVKSQLDEFMIIVSTFPSFKVHKNQTEDVTAS